MARWTGEELVILAALAGFSPARKTNGIGHDRWAAAIALAESRGDPTAVSPTKDYGLWQINQVHNPTAQNWKDPYVNAQMAFKVYKNAGYSFRPWTTYPGLASFYLPSTAGVSDRDRKFFYEGRTDILASMEKFGKSFDSIGGVIAGGELGKRFTKEKLGEAVAEGLGAPWTAVQDWIESQALRVVMFAGGAVLLVLVIKKAV